MLQHRRKSGGKDEKPYNSERKISLHRFHAGSAVVTALPPPSASADGMMSVKPVRGFRKTEGNAGNELPSGSIRDSKGMVLIDMNVCQAAPR